ncbi:sensor histidine kinase [Pontimicrobium aquaticum]|uniref:GHKL domain-containing protein n=1 Tax=Pontimicrobium aquaticum TaxID=2565367 RepID=A0A4U0F1C1_9FLAO|nr:histidine kinase [Pontimicrobium aquaticum]TJY38060.1 GHKL domain-containing protein [Pontimicrobium aquaticum]
MIKFLKKYKAFFIGYIVIIPIFYFLDYIDLIILPEESTYEIIIFALIWGFLIALPIHNFNYLKRKQKTVLQVLGLFLLFFITVSIDSIMSLPDNPITFILLMGFWFGFAYVLIPEFIKKYWKLITLIYVPLLLYFIYLRLFSGDLEAYLKIKEEFPFYVFFLPIPIFFLVWLFEQWQWLQNLKAEKAKTEISLLRSQINPHFFFNTLNNLYALTVKNSKQAPEVILKLSDMMRYTIYEGEKETVKILDEIDYLNNYIELHKIRYKKSVEIVFNYSNIDTSLNVAPLLYIILLENAFKHGVETLSENAFIYINLYDDKDFIYFKIENNFDSKEKQESNGIGLQNLKRRLSLLYKEKHELSIDKTKNTYLATLKISKHA